MPLDQDQYAVSIHLVTMAGNEYTMQANLTHYEDITQLEDDILGFLPTVSDIDVFGCEVDLLELDTQLPLSEAFHTVLLQQKKLQTSPASNGKREASGRGDSTGPQISTDVDGFRRLFMVSAHGHQSGHQTLSEHSFGTK